MRERADLAAGLLQGELDRVDHVARPRAVGPLQRQARVDRQRVRAVLDGAALVVAAAAGRAGPEHEYAEDAGDGRPEPAGHRPPSGPSRGRPGRYGVRILAVAPSVMISGRDQERVQRLPADRPEDDPGAETDGGGDDETHCGASLTDEPGGELRYELAGRRGRVVGLGRGAHEPRADDHAVGARRAAASAACSGVAMPKPSATGTSVWRLTRPSSSPKACLAAAALAGRPGHRDGVEEAPRLRADQREARRRSSSARRAARARRRARRRPSVIAGSSPIGRSGTIRPLMPGLAQAR